jgi:hypothetical protein
MTEEQLKKLLEVLERIADSLENIERLYIESQ